MMRFGLKASLLAVIFLASAGSAMATIETVKGTLTCFIGCNKNVVQLVAQGEDHSFEVVGPFVDTSTAVEITGSGVSVSYGTRRHGAGSSIIVRFDVGSNAALGERTVRMRYAIETNGPDTFKVRVVRKGTISQVQYRRPRPIQLGGGTELVPATGLPLNQTVVLLVSGTKLDSVEVRPQSNYRSVRVLPGATATQAEIEIEFSSSGQGPLVIFDAALSTQDMNSSTSSSFSYTGGANRNIQFGGATGGGSTPIFTPIIGSSGGSPSTFVDAAPRANMLNVFRRQSQNPVFTQNGVQYFSIDSQQFCNGMTGTQTRIITVPDPLWGVSNVGTADINTAFAAQLRSGTVTLATETVPGLNPGETRNFTFVRQDSRVRVFTFLTRSGCFVSPTADEFFEDPPFTVVVNTNGALVEAAANTANNTRTY